MSERQVAATNLVYHPVPVMLGSGLFALIFPHAQTAQESGRFGRPTRRSGAQAAGFVVVVLVVVQILIPQIP